MYITQNMCIIVKRNFNFITGTVGRPTFKIYVI
jgi:hypothetical protein